MKQFFTLGALFILMVIPMPTSANDIPFGSRFSENAVIFQLFEMFRSLMKFGDIEKNIPVMDPYIFNAKQARVQALVVCEVNITNGVISGLSNFLLEDFAFTKDEVALGVIVKIPVIKFDAEYYEMEGVMLESLPIAGSGILNFLAKNVTINSKLYLKRSADGKSVTIDKLHNTSFIIEKVLSCTEYDKNIDDVLNAMVEDLLAGYLTRFSKYIAKTYEDYTVNILNSILDKYDTWSTLATILHLSRRITPRLITMSN